MSIQISEGYHAYLDKLQAAGALALEREAFEKWFESLQGEYAERQYYMRRDGNGEYVNEHVRFCWSAWIKRATIALQANNYRPGNTYDRSHST